MNAIRHKGEFQQYTVKIVSAIKLALKYPSNLMVVWSMYIDLYISKVLNIVLYNDWYLGVVVKK